MSRRLENTRRKREKKSDSERSIEAAREAGAKYAQDQLSGDYFHDWVWDQMSEAEEMRKRDPNSVIPLRGPDDYHEVARNMLQQLRWDIDRDLNPREVIGDASREEQQAFWDGLHDELRDPKVRSWLVEELIVPMHKEVTDGPRQRSLPGVQAREVRSVVRAPRQTEGMTPEQRAAVVATLQRYGADLTPDGFITKGGKTLSVRVDVRRGRLRIMGPSDNLLASYPASRIEHGVSDFVEKFWYWKPVQASENRRTSSRLHSGLAARGSRRRPSR